MSEYVGSGDLIISGNSEFEVRNFFGMQFPWQVSGEIEASFTSSWNVGGGEYHWYRVEGECGSLSCGINNVNMEYDDCPNRSLATFVAARNLAEVCENLQNPNYNPPVRMRLKSIARYTRPLLKSQIIDGECNKLEETEFCQIAECLDFCIDQNVLVRVDFSTTVDEDIKSHSMSGAIQFSGFVETNKYRIYRPTSPIIEFGGSFDSLYSTEYVPNSGLYLSGSFELQATFYDYTPEGGFQMGGYARTTSPSRSYNFLGGVFLASSTKIGRKFSMSPGFGLSGSSPSLVSLSILSSVQLQIQSNSEFTSPVHHYEALGDIEIGGEATRNFESLGVFLQSYELKTSVVSIESEFPILPDINTITAGSSNVIVGCGCAPLGQNLVATHNLAKSKTFGNFLLRNSLSVPYESYMRYRATDKSWNCTEHYSGYSTSSSYLEDWTLSISLSCKTSYWLFSFKMQSSYPNSKKKRTQFSLELPSSYVCSTGNISTLISMDINTLGQEDVLPGTLRGSRSFSPRGVGILVVDSDRNTEELSSGINISTNGTYVDFSSYFDDLGLFSDSYWQNVPFEIKINVPRGTYMQQADIGSLFPSEPIFNT